MWASLTSDLHSNIGEAQGANSTVLFVAIAFSSSTSKLNKYCKKLTQNLTTKMHVVSASGNEVPLTHSGAPPRGSPSMVDFHPETHSYL